MQKKLNQILINKKHKYQRISFEKFTNEEEMLIKLAELLSLGTDVIELYAPNIPTQTILQTGKKLREITAQFDAILIIFDRIDIAKILEADGVTLDNTTMTISQAQKLIENTMLVGYIAVTQDDALYAQKNKADFLITNKNPKNTTIKTFFKE